MNNFLPSIATTTTTAAAASTKPNNESAHATVNSAINEPNAKSTTNESNEYGESNGKSNEQPNEQSNESNEQQCPNEFTSHKSNADEHAGMVKCFIVRKFVYQTVFNQSILILINLHYHANLNFKF